jgi:hypothetical protein
MEAVKMWLSSEGADFFDTDILKLFPRYDKCLSSGGEYAEKYVAYARIFLYIIVKSSKEVTFRIAAVELQTGARPCRYVDINRQHGRIIIYRMARLEFLQVCRRSVQLYIFWTPLY